MSDSSQLQECTQQTTDVKFCWCDQIGASHTFDDHKPKQDPIEIPVASCSFCDNPAEYVQRYEKTGIVFSCNPCGVWLDDKRDIMDAVLWESSYPQVEGFNPQTVNTPETAPRHAV